MNKKNLQKKVREVESYSGFPPACACGCGEPTRFGVHGLQKYVNKTHLNWDKDYKELSVAGNTARAESMIPIEDFRKAVKRLLQEKNWTISHMAKKAGQQPGWLHTYLYDSRINHISLEVAQLFFRRLAGQPTLATRYEQRTAPKSVKKTDKVIEEIGADANKIKMNTDTFAPKKQKIKIN